MNEVVRSFANHLGFESNIWLEKWQHQFPNLATIVGAFGYYKTNQHIQYVFDSWIDAESFERLGENIHQKSYLITPEEFLSYRNSVTQTFDNLEAIAKAIVRKAFLGETQIQTTLPLDEIVVDTIQVYPSQGRLFFNFILPDGSSLPFERSGLAYYEIIQVNAQLVAAIVELAKSRSIATDNFFNLQSSN